MSTSELKRAGVLARVAAGPRAERPAARLHDLRGLVHKGRRGRVAAGREFEEALSLDVNQLWARMQLGD